MSDFNMTQRLAHLDDILNGRFDLEEEDEKEEDEKEEETQFSNIITEEMITSPSTSTRFVEDLPEEDEEEDLSYLTEYDEKEIDRSSIDYDSKQPVSAISDNATNPDSMTLDEFIDNSKINGVAYKFFQEMGEDSEEGTAATDMMYYFRKEISIDDMIRRVNQSKDWSDEQKNRYLYLKDQFAKTDWSDSSFQQKFKSVRQYGWQAISDPSMVVAMLLAPMTGGGSVAVRTGAAETGKFLLRSALINTMKSGVTKKNVGAVAKSLVSTPAKSSATYSGLYSGVIERLNQEVNMELGIQDKEQGVNYTDWATHTGLGIVFGGVLGKGVEKLPVVTTPIKNAIAKTYTLTDELTGNLLTKATEVIIQRPMDTAMARSFGTAVAEFKTIAKYSPSAKRILESIKEYINKQMNKFLKDILMMLGAGKESSL